ncbi:UvrD-helicase domain-containing protein [Niameybacter sp.]|uniref:UvrD-helicase domain-containing protein n=1 Tax=Niameybacter sp. TaxID=2033640 RepID=UPI002FC6CB2F
MKAQKLLMDIRFERSLPDQNKEAVLNKIGQFVWEWHTTKDKNQVGNKYSVKKIKTTTKLAAVWKFKVSAGNRVLFMKGKDVEGLEEQDQDALVLLEFCTHDKQILTAREKAQVNLEGYLGESEQDRQSSNDVLRHQLEELLEQSVEQVARRHAERLEYNLATSITRPFKYMNIEDLVNLDKLQGIFYLNAEQRRCVNQPFAPFLLFGSAGSGKTTIGVYKLIQLLTGDPNLKVGYFTYSAQLSDTAKKIYANVKRNELSEEERRLQEGSIDFYPIKMYLRQYGGARKIVEYEQFHQEFYREAYANYMQTPKYKKACKGKEAYDVWKEIRGILKGFGGINWDLEVLKTSNGMLLEEVYIKLDAKYSPYNLEERQFLYKLACDYCEWLKRGNLYDENDLARAVLKSGTQFACYDWIVIDEVQDLSELEFYMLLNLVKSPENFLMSGDYHQTITPTYFDTRRIVNFLERHKLRYKEDENQVFLCTNYRNPQKMVEVGNHIAHLRQAVFGKDKRNDKDYERAMQKTVGKLFTLRGSRQEQLKLLEEAVQKAYTYIVVATESEKVDLQKRLKDYTHIFTISEIKGLENRYIIGYNLISSYQKKWETLCESIQRGIVVEESHLYRYLFNMLYVALTRTQENLCLMDEGIPLEQYETLLGCTPQDYDTFDVAAFDLLEVSTLLDFFQAALKLEAAGKYDRAIVAYQKLSLPQVPHRIALCEAKQYEEAGEYEVAAKLYQQEEDYEKAAACYDYTPHRYAYYTCLLAQGEDVFVDKVIRRADFNYTRDLAPYCKGPLKIKIESLCIRYGYQQLVGQEEKMMGQQLILLELQETLSRLEEAIRAEG